ncbi:MAG: ABC transporter ATP-binding protein [Bacteroidota bacterium]|nr:ABC transporter ATP-binding protein [Bacteroidota bacterium]
MVVVILLSILLAFLDGLGLTMFLPLLKLADGSAQVSGEELGSMSFIVSYLDGLGIKITLINSLLFLLFFFCLKGIVSYFISVYKVHTNQYFISKLRVKLTNLFTRYSFQSFVSSDVGRIQNALTEEVGRVTNAFNYYLNCLQNIFLTVTYLLFVFIADWKFALLVCLGGGISNVIYSSIYKKTKKESAKLSKNNSDYQGLIIQYISNFKYLKATGGLKTYAEKLTKVIFSIEKNNIKMGKFNSIIGSTREPIIIAIVCMVIIIQIKVFNGNLSSILVSLLFFYRALGSFTSFQGGYNNFLNLHGSIENIQSFEVELYNGIEKNGNIKLKTFKNNIVLENIGFGYQKDNGILNNLSLNIERNKSVAFIGESGSGKTTLVNLISGLLEPNNGTLLIDGIPLDELNKESYQSRIGYIAQEPVIFNDSIFANVTFWAEPTPENIRRFEDAIQKAFLKSFVDGLPEKEQTMLGNNGINLSGGQKQRISIARELYKDIDILVLDEATSALDSETEKEIQQNIDALKGKYTVLIIAHRLSTIRNVDEIYLMEKGRITAHDSFDNLLTKSDKFRKMVELQEI